MGYHDIESYFHFIIDVINWCCNIIKKYPDFTPTVDFGSFKDAAAQEEWKTKECDFLVAGRLKRCPGV